MMSAFDFNGGAMKPALRAAAIVATLGVIGGLTLRAADNMTIRGQVVDAACFMMHPHEAAIASHKECGEACLKTGVPLAIANEADGKLYFPADPKPLRALIGQRVEVVGSVELKKEPMELKMPVGTTNQMSVRVDGGYNVVTVEKMTKLGAAKPVKKK
jgi:hypothetical protein